MKGGKKEDVIPREWKWGGEHLDCYAPATLWLLLCSSQMWEGPQLMWSLPKQKKHGRKVFRFIFLILYILNFPYTWFVSVYVYVCVRACKRMCISMSECVCVFSMLQSEKQNMHFAGKVRTFLREWGHRGRSNSSCSLGNSCCCHGYMWRATSEEERCGNSGGTVWMQPAAEDLWSHEWKTMLSQRRR